MIEAHVAEAFGNIIAHERHPSDARIDEVGGMMQRAIGDEPGFPARCFAELTFVGSRSLGAAVASDAVLASWVNAAGSAFADAHIDAQSAWIAPC